MRNDINVGIIGPLLGVNKNWVLTQGEVLARKLIDDGYKVKTSSNKINRFLRLCDIVKFILFNREIDVFIVKVFSGRAFLFTELALKLIKKKPVILWLHGGNLKEFAQNNNKRFFRTVKKAKKIVVPSNFLGQLVKDVPCVRVLPNILPNSSYPFRKLEKVTPRILWMRTFESMYNPLMALKVIKRLKHKYPDILLSMCGQDKGLLNEIKQASYKMGIAENVKFGGFLEGSKKEQYFLGHDIFINTTNVDNSPVSLLEAAAYGLPIVTTVVGGIPDIFENNKTALFVDKKDDEQMASIIIKLLDGNINFGEITKNAQEQVKINLWSNVGYKWKELIGNIC
ncbi:MAG: glycosyltransferase family 4 protein [Candidatus Omnitrophota bacterium]|jgi:glycosyltransferase involved in cell wall biosynthesis